MLKLFARLLGTKSERDLRALRPYVAQINAQVEQLRPLSHDALRSRVPALQKHIQATLQPLTDQRQALEKQAADDLKAIERRHQDISKLEKQYHEQLEAMLMELLPEAFAIVKETARRFKDNAELTVTATAHDRALADASTYVTLQGDQAIWQNTWEAGGSPIVWDMVHYDVQLIGGIILHQGKIAEMATGEGKTLVATLPAFLNALAGRGVHIVTVNDYLATRDAAWMAPLFEFHGLRVDCIDKHPSHTDARKDAYQADITYGTNNEFGFDYLRDNMATSPDEVVQRTPHYAMVDEVDSVLIDDARTPLIISGPVEHSNEQDYLLLKPRIQQLYNAQKTLVNQLLQEAKKHIADGNTDEGGLALFRAYRGLPKHKPLIKYLSEVGTKKILHKTENYYLQDNARLMPEADEPLLFVIEEKNNSIELTEKGLEYITQQEEDPQFFVLPDIGAEVARIEQNDAHSEADKLVQKDALIKDYGIKSQRLHVIQQLLKAYTLFEIDVDYIIVDKRVKIVDEQTGRVLEGRRYSDGLHQALEAKENVKIEKASQTYATITLQNYFRMYHKLAGMTGTAITEAGEFWEIYQLDVVVTPSHKPLIRDDRNDKVYKTAREKFQAIIEEIIELTQQNRPVLVGTTSVENSELVSRLLTMRKIKHQVLNAKHHQREAEIVAEAGKPGTVTIATNMAGRGTDIKLTPEAKVAGGLAIIGTERHESRRVDRQLRGRAGRQGDVGSSQFFVSLEDNLMRLFGSDRIASLMDRMGLQEGEVIQHSMITRSIQRAQKKVEQSNFGIRKRLLEYDNVMNSQREVIYKKRRHALFGKRLDWDLKSMLHETVEGLQADYPDSTQSKALQAALHQIFGPAASITPDANTEALYQQVLKAHQDRKAQLQHEAAPLVQALAKVQDTSPTTFSVPYASADARLQVAADLQACIHTSGQALVQSLEKITLLHYIDQHWKDHLRAMDDLKQSVQNAVYERQDPLVIYKLEGYNLFQQLLRTINHTTLTFLHQAGLQAHHPEEVTAEEAYAPAAHESSSTLSESKQMIESLLGPQHPSLEQPAAQPRKSQKVAQRNQRVTVRYGDGTIKEDVKYKNVEDDLNRGQCELV